MFWRAKGWTVGSGGAETEVVSFGTGPRTLVMLPGVGDGLKTVRGTAIPLAWMFRAFAREYRVFVLSRRNTLPEQCSTREMARYLRETMEALGIERADVIGVSMGGMIAQYLAIDWPERVHKLVLTVTLARPNEAILAAGNAWLALAEQGDAGGILLDTAERGYSEEYLRKNRRMLGVMSKVWGVRDLGRFITQARACMTHDAYGELGRIQCPTLIVGGERDEIVTGEASRELAAQIGGSQLLMYGQYGHGLYEEAEDFQERVLEFLRE